MAELYESDKALTGKQVTKIIKDFDNTVYKKNWDYYQGNNVAIHKSGKEKADKNINPNNIIPLPFARRTINDLQGYAYKPGNVKYIYSDESPPASIDIINEILENNEEAITSAEVFQNAAIQGQGAELLYYADDEIQFAQIPREQVIFRYEDSVKSDKLEWAVRFYETIEILPSGKDVKRHIADVYTDKEIHHYEYQKKDDETEINQQQGQKIYDNLKEVVKYEYMGSEPHPFGDVPLYPYNINSDRLGVFQPSIPIIDRLDEFGSDSISNAIDQFNDSILTLSKQIDDLDIEKLRELRVIDNLGGKDEGNFAEFLQRNLDIESSLESTKIFERWYYELTGVPNLHEEKFGTKSGIAILYALVPFENLVTTMEIYFSRSLEYRIELINNALLEITSGYTPVEVTTEWKRNLPFDLKNRVDIVVALKNAGILSDETLIKMFPDNIVEDAEEEIKRREDEKMENMARFQDKQNMLVQEPKLEEEEDD
jgi:SPP1 family phage portal protein